MSCNVTNKTRLNPTFPLDFATSTTPETFSPAIFACFCSHRCWKWQTRPRFVLSAGIQYTLPNSHIRWFDILCQIIIISPFTTHTAQLDAGNNTRIWTARPPAPIPVAHSAHSAQRLHPKIGIGTNTMERKATDNDHACCSSKRSENFRQSKGKRKVHPLKMPRRVAPTTGLMICRFFNYGVCHQGDEKCSLDHTTCHVCLEEGHRALQCDIFHNDEAFVTFRKTYTLKNV